MGQLQSISIDVTFHPDLIDTDAMFTFSGKISDKKEITVEPGLAFILFRLFTAPGLDPLAPPASFQTNPVQWFGTAEDGSSTKEPVPLPTMFVVQRISDTTLTLLDFNSNQFHDRGWMYHWFNIVVSFNGRTYGSDPTIINLPPG